ncbi:MAG: hypothetical protein AB7E85_06575 [Pseudobdellovibrionaceae bacterium]
MSTKARPRKLTVRTENDVDFIDPDNPLKEKVGDGGLSKDKIASAQRVIDENTEDFALIADPYFTALAVGRDSLLNPSETETDEDRIERLILAAMQLKSTGALFQYPIISQFADNLQQFLEQLATLDPALIEILDAHVAAMKYILEHEMKGRAGAKTDAMFTELQHACQRYRFKYPQTLRSDD